MLPVLVVLISGAEPWSPQMVGELVTSDGRWLWWSEAATEDELVVDLTRRHGRSERLARMFPHGFRLDVRRSAPVAA